jgi:hypothetical protein
LLKSGDFLKKGSPDLFFALSVFYIPSKFISDDAFNLVFSLLLPRFIYIFFYENTSFIPDSFNDFAFAGFAGIFAATG